MKEHYLKIIGKDQENDVILYYLLPIPGYFFEILITSSHFGYCAHSEK